jgi:hypothetical protein
MYLSSVCVCVCVCVKDRHRRTPCPLRMARGGRRLAALSKLHLSRDEFLNF